MHALIISIIAILVLAIIHLWSVDKNPGLWKKNLFSITGGMSVAYIFVDLLPQLSKGQLIWATTNPHLPFLEKHVYFLALIGVLFFYGIEKIPFKSRSGLFWTHASAYFIFNFLIGYTLSNPNDPEIQPYILFTIAIACHAWIRDHLLSAKYPKVFAQQARFYLAGALVLGWGIGRLLEIHAAAIALIIAFIAGSVMVNIFHYELPSDKSKHFLHFLGGGIAYGILLLFLG